MARWSPSLRFGVTILGSRPNGPTGRTRALWALLRGLLPWFDAGQEWRVVGTDVLIVEIATNVIVDVLKDAI